MSVILIYRYTADIDKPIISELDSKSKPAGKGYPVLLYMRFPFLKDELKRFDPNVNNDEETAVAEEVEGSEDDEATDGDDL